MGNRQQAAAAKQGKFSNKNHMEMIIFLFFFSRVSSWLDAAVTNFGLETGITNWSLWMCDVLMMLYGRSESVYLGAFDYDP